METIQLREAKAPYTVTIDDNSLHHEAMLVEPNGHPVAVLVPMAEYAAFRAWQARTIATVTDAIATDFTNERATFEQLLPELQQTYAGRVVAIFQGQVVEVGDTIGETANKVYERFGYVPCYVQHVTAQPKVYKMPHRKVVH